MTLRPPPTAPAPHRERAPRGRGLGLRVRRRLLRPRRGDRNADIGSDGRAQEARYGHLRRMGDREPLHHRHWSSEQPPARHDPVCRRGFLPRIRKRAVGGDVAGSRPRGVSRARELARPNDVFQYDPRRHRDRGAGCRGVRYNRRARGGWSRRRSDYDPRLVASRGS